MKNIVLTSGPRGAGKSTYVKHFVEQNQDVEYLSRDELLIELFGKTSLNPYTGDHQYAYELFSKKIKEVVESSKPNLNLIVDSWNGFSSGRKSMINNFRNLGADNVFCWKFITPKSTCLDWFMRKEDAKGYSKEGIASDYDLYHRKSIDIEEDGFDQVFYIDPLQLRIDFNGRDM